MASLSFSAARSRGRIPCRGGAIRPVFPALVLRPRHEAPAMPPAIEPDGPGRVARRVAAGPGAPAGQPAEGRQPPGQRRQRQPGQHSPVAGYAVSGGRQKPRIKPWETGPGKTLRKHGRPRREKRRKIRSAAPLPPKKCARHHGREISATPGMPGAQSPASPRSGPPPPPVSRTCRARPSCRHPSAAAATPRRRCPRRCRAPRARRRPARASAGPGRPVPPPVRPGPGWRPGRSAVRRRR
jgi:hypothetical protein